MGVPSYKDRLIQYLERFILGLVTLGGRIALLIGELEEQGRVEPLLSLAAAREAADAAPEAPPTRRALSPRERSRDAPCGIARRPGAFGPGGRPQRTFTARSHSFGPARGLVVQYGLVDPARWSAPAAGTVRFATVAAPPVSASSSVPTSP
ncbi:DUF2397 family protein [Streptomyces shenzhenensis]|uniref:DUF2397 family protein n=1 Tax=Streptomyces shenzhenensis TaxID=943815 RepID=UPI001F3DC37B|nr:DUF2397 family protein [Streptomyces shenzhenensis]